MPNLGVIPPATLSGQGVNKGSGIWWAINGHSNCTPIPGGTRRSPPGTWSHATCHPPGKVSCSLPLHGSTLPQVHHVPAEPLRQRPCARRTGGCCVCSAIRPSPYSCPSQGQSPPFAIRCPRATPCLGMLALGGGSGGQLGDARLCLGMGAGSTPAWHSLPLGEELDPADPSIPTHTP